MAEVLHILAMMMIVVALAIVGIVLVGMWDFIVMTIKHALGYKKRARILREAHQWHQDNPHIQLWSSKLDK